MNIKLLCFTILFSTITFLAPTLSSELPIKLSGTIEISVKTGTIDANFQLENIPRLKNYLIHLNSGFNIQYFRNEKDTFNYSYEKAYNTQYSEESFGYFFRNAKTKRKFLPKTIKFKYTGKFPVITDLNKESDQGDWKGNIAFNGKTIRTDGFQTAWYPILYDIEKDKRYDALTYDIGVTCIDCKSIYVNGSKPISSTHGKFTSVNPTSIILFAGDYDIKKQDDSYYLNSGLSNQQMSKLGAITSSFEKYYQNNLSIPYGENVVYIHTTPISKKDSWLFVSYPSIVSINHDKGGLSSFVDSSKSDGFQPFLAHELAHYYFGSYRIFNSELGDMFQESLAEYLSLKITQNLISESTYIQKIKNKLSRLKNKSYSPIKSIETKADFGNRNQYVYTYAPIIWLAIEKEIGEKKMWLWLNQLLKVKTNKTNYEFMIQTLSNVLNDDKKLNSLDENFFSSKNAISNARKLLLQKTNT